MDAAGYRAAILERLPPGTVTTAHTENEHFYKVVPTGKTYPSVTGKLQILKDEGLMNYKRDRALDHVFANRERMADPSDALTVLTEAKDASMKILTDAGDIGTVIHECREAYFAEWIRSGARPPNARAFIPSSVRDYRAVSGMRAIEKFCVEREYEPIVSELYVYSEEWEIGGALDDIGLVRHEGEKKLCLMDLKTSNRFKDTYFFQVAMYWEMFRTLTGVVPEHVLILKVSKEDGTYKLEEITELPKLVEYTGHMLKTNEAVQFIKALRKDNQREVAKL